MSRYVFQHHIRSSISRGIYTSRGTLATPPALLRCPAHKTLPRRYPPRLARCLPVKWSGGRNWLFPVKIFKYRNIFLCWLLLSTAHWNTSLRGGTNLISLNYNNTGEIFLKMRAEKWHINLQNLASFSLQCFLWSSGKGKGTGSTQEVDCRMSIIDCRLSIIDIDFPEALH